MSNRNLLRIGAIVSFIGMIVVNALATLLPINGVTTGQISDNYPNLFTPAGYTFSIWGVIYSFLLGYTVFQLFKIKAQGHRQSEAQDTIDAISPYYIGSSILNLAWILAWHYGQLWLSVLLMLGLLVSLIKINLILDKFKTHRFTDNVLIKAPFSIYFGWITVATVANITAFLVNIGWDGWGLSDSTWMIVVLAVSTAIGLMALYRFKSWQYGAVLVWAFGGILAKHVAPDGWDNQYSGVIVTLYCSMSALVAMTVFLLLRSRVTLAQTRSKIRP